MSKVGKQELSTYKVKVNRLKISQPGGSSFVLTLMARCLANALPSTKRAVELLVVGSAIMTAFYIY